MKHLKITLSTLLISFLIFSCSSDDGGDSDSGNSPSSSSDCSLSAISGIVYSQVPLTSNGVDRNDIPNTNLPILFEVSESTDLITENLRRNNEDENDRFFRIRAVKSFATSVNGFIDFNNLDEDNDFINVDYRLGDCTLDARKSENSPSVIDLAINLLGCSSSANAFSNQLRIIDKGNTIEVIHSCGIIADPDSPLFDPSSSLVDTVIYHKTDLSL